jgi:hypothetical protein
MKTKEARKIRVEQVSVQKRNNHVSESKFCSRHETIILKWVIKLGLWVCRLDSSCPGWTHW